jgi:hypothetical protein
MRVLKKPVDGKPVVVEIGGSLESLQESVGGYIEAVGLFDKLTLICNEDGKLTGLPYNFMLPNGDHVVGDVIFVREDKSNFCSMSDSDIKKICHTFGFGPLPATETKDLPFGSS